MKNQEEFATLMGTTICFANQKGGTGKTTSAVNVAAAVGQMGKKVLLIDADPQGNATSAVGIKKKSLVNTTYDVIIGRIPAKDAVVATKFQNLWVIPTNVQLAGADVELVNIERRAERLRDNLATIKDDYDYIFIDCLPSLGLTTVSALTASDGVIIPMQCEYFALEGLSQLMNTLKQIKKTYNEHLEIIGIIVTMFNNRLNLSMEVLGQLKKYYADKLFTESVPRSVKLSEAPSFGTPISYYDKGGKGTEAYESIAKEIIQRVEK